MPDLRPHLRLVESMPVSAAACASSGCCLPAGDGFGLCEACERVYRCVLVLCDRLLDRDLARVEHETPGITAAARVALTGTPVSDLVNDGGHVATGLEREPWAALLPMPDELESLNELLSELVAGFRRLGVIA